MSELSTERSDMSWIFVRVKQKSELSMILSIIKDRKSKNIFIGVRVKQKSELDMSELAEVYCIS